MIELISVLVTIVVGLVLMALIGIFLWATGKHFGWWTMPDRRLFTSDGCSGGMSWAWRLIVGKAPPWEGLCVKHDRAYWAGGSRRQRREADAALMAGVIQAGYPLIARAMYASVRIGGCPWWPFPWRWGYGRPWPWRLWYSAPMPAEG